MQYVNSTSIKLLKKKKKKKNQKEGEVGEKNGSKFPETEQAKHGGPQPLKERKNLKGRPLRKRSKITFHLGRGVHRGSGHLRPRWWCVGGGDVWGSLLRGQEEKQEKRGNREEKLQVSGRALQVRQRQSRQGDKNSGRIQTYGSRTPLNLPPWF